MKYNLVATLMWVLKYSEDFYVLKYLYLRDCSDKIKYMIKIHFLLNCSNERFLIIMRFFTIDCFKD